MCVCTTDEKRTLATQRFVCTKVLCSLSTENLPKKSVCVFRRRHSPTEEEEEEEEEERNATKESGVVQKPGRAGDGGKRSLRGEGSI